MTAIVSSPRPSLRTIEDVRDSHIGQQNYIVCDDGIISDGKSVMQTNQ